MLEEEQWPTNSTARDVFSRDSTHAATRTASDVQVTTFFWSEICVYTLQFVMLLRCNNYDHKLKNIHSPQKKVICYLLLQYNNLQRCIRQDGSNTNFTSLRKMYSFVSFVHNITIMRLIVKNNGSNRMEPVQWVAFQMYRYNLVHLKWIVINKLQHFPRQRHYEIQKWNYFRKLITIRFSK